MDSFVDYRRKNVPNLKAEEMQLMQVVVDTLLPVLLVKLYRGGN